MWNPVSADISLLQVIDEKIRQLQTRDSAYLPDFGESPALLLSSDYSGEHRQSPYIALSFLLLPLKSWRAWEQERVAIRRRCHALDRRIGYGRLGGVKRRLMREFLRVAGSVKGLLVTVLIRKSLHSILDTSGEIDRARWQVEHCVSWKKPALEKMLRVVHFAAFLIAGLSSTNQIVRWITDQDDIAPNDARFQEMARVFALTADRYLSHKLHHLGCSTTAESPLEVEDFAAIPDLAGGALVELFTAYHQRQVTLSEHLVIPRPDTLPGKAHEILDWLADDLNLRRLVYTVDPGPHQGTIEITDVNLNGHSLLIR